MSLDGEIVAVSGGTYEAALDHSLWSSVLTQFLDVTNGHFSGFRDALIMVDRSGRIIAMSKRAGTLLAGCDGLCVEDMALKSSTALSQGALEQALSAALDPSLQDVRNTGIAIPRPSGSRPYALVVSPLPRQPSPLWPMSAAALVRIIDPDETSNSDESVLRQLYGLTRAETKIVQALLSGEGNIRSIAENIGVAYATARVQLASIFDKMRVNSQTELVKLVTRITG